MSCPSQLGADPRALTRRLSVPSGSPATPRSRIALGFVLAAIALKGGGVVVMVASLAEQLDGRAMVSKPKVEYNSLRPLQSLFRSGQSAVLRLRAGFRGGIW